MVLLALALLVVVPAADAAAPTLATITAHLRSAAQYDDPAAKVSTAQQKAINAAITKAAKRKRILRVAVLSAAPPDAPAETAAPRLRARLKLKGTMIVALPTGIQVASLNVSGAKLAQVRAAVVGKSGPAGARVAITALLAKTIAAPPTTSTATQTTPVTTPIKKKSSGTSMTTIILIAVAAVIVAIALVLTWLRARTRKVRRRGGGTLIAGARALLQGRLEGLGEGLAATAVGVTEREDRTVAEHHATASEIVAEVRSSIGRLDGPPAFRHAHGLLDDAEWHLGVVEAHLEGVAEPPRPEAGHPARCFFDADHGLATVPVELEIPGVRTVTVGICAADAVRLSRAEEPEVGSVSVGRRRMPWAAAPTWYGGWGWGQDDLPTLRYHGAPVFSSRSQLDAIGADGSDTGSFPRSITVRPAPSEPQDGEPQDGEPQADQSQADELQLDVLHDELPADGDTLEVDAPTPGFIPDDEPIVLPADTEALPEDVAPAVDADGDEGEPHPPA
jgi:hypothetical protein